MQTSRDLSLLLDASTVVKGRWGIALLNLSSLGLLMLISGTVLTGITLSAYGVLTYLGAQQLGRIDSAAKRAWLFYGIMLALCATFIYLQKTAKISILNAENVLEGSTLPYLVGFAFYLLQGLGILGAVYRRSIPPLDFQRHMVALSFFGSFLAGPLFNQQELKKLVTIEARLPTLERLYENLHYFVGGLLFKFVFANWLARFVDLNEAQSPLGIARSVGAFELQVYFDFAGYSLIALFLCRSFGLPMYFNFSHPFAARDVPEFWRRWHIGLGTWFKENLFQPLRAHTRSRWLGKLLLPLVVFLASAAWHGPTLNFLAWGLFHGLAFLTTVLLLSRFKEFVGGRFLTRIHVLLVIFYGRLLFMDSDFDRLLSKLRRLGMFKRMAGEFIQGLPRSSEAWIAFLSRNWSDVMIGSSIAALIFYELFWVSAETDQPYAYFKPGFWTLAAFALFLIFFQPLEVAGFVYGR